MSTPVFLMVFAEPRYWEDSTVDGEEDVDGSLIPCREGILFKPIIELATGKIINWPEGITARIHYKVCDQGEYFLADQKQRFLLKYYGHYVPDAFLCVGDTGYGDYIIFSVNAEGFIEKWIPPIIEPDQWLPILGKDAPT